MTTSEKLTLVKTILGISASDTSLDDELTAYLNMAGEEILNWMYINHPSDRPEGTAAVVPIRYSMVQVNAVVNGFSHKGAEGETIHNENGINRTFVYDDMIAYIHDHVYQLI